MIILYHRKLCFRIKNAWMYKDEKLFLENKAREMILPSIEEQAALPEKPLEVYFYHIVNFYYCSMYKLEFFHPFIILTIVYFIIGTFC